MPYLICYDIESNTLRTKVAQKILQTGLERVNRSVYIGAPTDADMAQLENYLQVLMASVGQANDSLIVLPITTHQVYQMRVFGHNEWTAAALVGDAHTVLL